MRCWSDLWVFMHFAIQRDVRKTVQSMFVTLWGHEGSISLWTRSPLVEFGSALGTGLKCEFVGPEVLYLNDSHLFSIYPIACCCAFLIRCNIPSSNTLLYTLNRQIISNLSD